MEQSGVPFQCGMTRDANYNATDNVLPQYKPGWYFSRTELDNFSPSRKDGISSNRESKLRMRYCAFIKEFGRRLGVPQITIATALVFCHRFYLQHSLAKNAWQTVATACMFLSSKVEDTPISVDTIVVAAYEIFNRRKPDIACRIHQKDEFIKQKTIVLKGEQLLLSAIQFEFNIQHPYRALLLALKKFEIIHKDVRQVAWNFVNDSLQTTLCLQYKPNYIASGSIFLAAKLHNVKLPSEKGYVWWQEFDVAPQQLQVVVEEMADLLGCKRRPVETHEPEKPTLTSKHAPALTRAPVRPTQTSSHAPVVTHAPEKPILTSTRLARALEKPLLTCIHAPAMACVTEKPTLMNTSLVAMKEPFSSPVSCIFNGLNSSKSCSGQCFSEMEAQLKPVITASNISGPSNWDGQPACLMGQAEFQCQTRVFRSTNDIVEDCLRSGEHVDKRTANPEQDFDEGANQMPEQVAPEHSVRTGLAGLAPAMPEEFGTADCQILGENINLESREAEKAADVVKSLESGLNVEREQTVIKESDNHDVSQQHDEVLCHARAKAERVQAGEISEGSGEHVEQIGPKLEHVEDILWKTDRDSNKALLERRKQESYQAKAKHEHAAICEFYQVSSHDVDQERNNCDKAEDRLSKIDVDRIKALMMTRKREREIERELEAGVELAAESAQKKQRLAFRT